MKKRYFVLEWNALDDSIDLYDFESEKEDISEVYEEIAEGLHNYSNVLIMEKKRLDNLFKAVESFKEYLKGIGK